MKNTKTNKMPTEKQFLPFNELTAITPLDGRYRSRVTSLAPYVSEYALIKYRFEVEAKYLVALSSVGVVRKLSDTEQDRLNGLGQSITLENAAEVKKIEDETRHDVKAMERAFRGIAKGTSLEDLTEMIHFGLTSEDINNLAYRMMLRDATVNVCIPAMDELVDELVSRAEVYKDTPMLARTHGQAAVPTTVGKEFAVFASRLNNEVRGLEKRPLRGKLNGAVGNFNALNFAYPDVDWVKFSTDFVSSLGFEPNLVTTQINTYEDVISYLQNYQRINGVVLDMDQDIWSYISDFWLVQEAKKGEVGSSTMPQKVNPIDFENSEGNVQIANSIIEGMVRKLAVSRLQRDLSDSTTVRNIGPILGHSLLGYTSAVTGLKRTKVNEEQIRQGLEEEWSILSEGVQTVLRAERVDDPYSLISALTRGGHLTQSGWQELIDGLSINDDTKAKLRNLRPELYTGLASELTTQAIQRIRDSRK